MTPEQQAALEDLRRELHDPTFEIVTARRSFAALEAALSRASVPDDLGALVEASEQRRARFAAVSGGITLTDFVRALAASADDVPALAHAIGPLLERLAAAEGSLAEARASSSTIHRRAQKAEGVARHVPGWIAGVRRMSQRRIAEARRVAALWEDRYHAGTKQLRDGGVPAHVDGYGPNVIHGHLDVLIARALEQRDSALAALETERAAHAETRGQLEVKR